MVRFLVKVTIPRTKVVEASKSGTLARTLNSAMQSLRPESAYFFEQDGNRECLFVFNLDVPSLLKPLFPNLDASFYVTPVRTAAELEQELGQEGRGRPMQTSDFLADLDPAQSETAGSRRDVGPEGPEQPAPSRPEDVLREPLGQAREREGE
jgi:hypothetical protein